MDLSTSSSLSSSAGTTTAAGITTAAPGEKPSGASESTSTNAILIIVSATVIFVLCVGSVVAVLLYFCVRHSGANDEPDEAELQEVKELSSDYGALDLDDLVDDKAGAGPQHNVQEGVSHGEVVTSSEGAYHNISRGARCLDGSTSQAGAYHNTKPLQGPHNDRSYHNVGSVTHQVTEEGAYHNVKMH